LNKGLIYLLFTEVTSIYRVCGKLGPGKRIKADRKKTAADKVYNLFNRFTFTRRQQRCICKNGYGIFVTQNVVGDLQEQSGVHSSGTGDCGPALPADDLLEILSFLC
jgi:hypothetical protein